MQERFSAHNVMICHGIVKFYGRKNTKPCCLIKLDIKKAYDSVEWSFLEEMLTTLNFPQNFINLVMECIKSARFSLSLNGTRQGFFLRLNED